jgi:hypothetical protein
VLRTALTLAKAGQKLSVAAPGASVSLDEVEVGLLLEALHFAIEEIQWTFKTKTHDEEDARRRDAVLTAFPELADRGRWRSFGLSRDLEALAARLQSALSA